MSKYPGELSGGQRQRASIARAIILGPDLVVADEPVSMLDMSVRAKVLQLLVDLKQELGLTYLYVTHDLATARFFCDRVAIMYLGRIVEIGATDELYRNPRHPYTRALLEAIPEPDPEHRIPRRLPRGEVPDATVPPLGCSFHPRCPEAFGPCGWESRDLRNLLEMRWAALGPDEFRKERDVLGDLSGLSVPSLDVDVPAAPGHSGSDVATLLEWHREVRSRRAPLERRGPDGARADGGTGTFPGPRRPGPHGWRAPGAAQVACHLYDPRPQLSRARSRRSLNEPREVSPCRVPASLSMSRSFRPCAGRERPCGFLTSGGASATRAVVSSSWPVTSRAPFS